MYCLKHLPSYLNNLQNIYYVYMFHMCMGVEGVQKREWDLLETGLQTVVSCVTWVLGTQHRSSIGTAGALNG